MAAKQNSTESPPAGGGELDPRTAREWLRSGSAVLVDVREADEYEKEHIAGAHLLPLSGFKPAQLAAVAARARGAGPRIILHCKSGRRSADALRMAAGAAAAPLFTLGGGIEAWKAQGLPVQQGRGGISILRQVQLTVGAMVLAGVALGWLVDPLFLVAPAFFGAGLLFAGATGTCGLAAVLGLMPWNRAGEKCGCVGAACSESKP